MVMYNNQGLMNDSSTITAVTLDRCQTTFAATEHLSASVNADGLAAEYSAGSNHCLFVFVYFGLVTCTVDMRRTLASAGRS